MGNILTKQRMVTESLRKVLEFLLCVKYYQDDQTKNEMGRACRTYEGNESA